MTLAQWRPARALLLLGVALPVFTAPTAFAQGGHASPAEGSAGPRAAIGSEAKPGPAPPTTATAVSAGAQAVLSYYRGVGGPAMQRPRLVCGDANLDIGTQARPRMGRPQITIAGSVVALVGGHCPGAVSRE